MHVLVDLARCQSYGQCVYEAPDVFRLVHEEVLEFQHTVDDARRAEVERARTACPVQAIRLGGARPAWLQRVSSPRLVVDPPPYRASSGLRGPRHLLVDHDGVTA